MIEISIVNSIIRRCFHVSGAAKGRLILSLQILELPELCDLNVAQGKSSGLVSYL